jgi:hypothetical protein
VGYQRWLIAKGNYFSPSAAAVGKLVEQLRTEKWILDPKSGDMEKLRFRGKREELAGRTGGYAVQTVENEVGEDAVARLTANVAALPANLTEEWLDDPDREELRLVWPVAGDDPLPLKYPLSRRPDAPVSYALELHRAPDYVYPISATIGELQTVCRCGEELAFGWDEEELVPAFESASGIYGECQACSRTFDPSQQTAAITDPFDGARRDVRGGAAYRFALKVDCGKCFVPDPSLTFAPDLVALVEAAFGRDFYEVGSKV